MKFDIINISVGLINIIVGLSNLYDRKNLKRIRHIELDEKLKKLEIERKRALDKLRGEIGSLASPLYANLRISVLKLGMGSDSELRAYNEYRHRIEEIELEEKKYLNIMGKDKTKEV